MLAEEKRLQESITVLFSNSIWEYTLPAYIQTRMQSLIFRIEYNVQK